MKTDSNQKEFPMSESVQKITRTALLCALLCVLSPLSFAVGPIPITLATLGIYLCGLLGGWIEGGCAVLLYLAIGCIGLPVFSSFRGGLSIFAGPTGGYLVGYLPCAALTALGRGRSLPRRFLAMLLGTAICYSLGTGWYMLQTGSGLFAALSLCVLPFLPGDAIKITASAFLSRKLDSHI